jgi:hypothetical protein
VASHFEILWSLGNTGPFTEDLKYWRRQFYELSPSMSWLQTDRRGQFVFITSSSEYFNFTTKWKFLSGRFKILLVGKYLLPNGSSLIE